MQDNKERDFWIFFTNTYIIWNKRVVTYKKTNLFYVFGKKKNHFFLLLISHFNIVAMWKLYIKGFTKIDYLDSRYLRS